MTVILAYKEADESRRRNLEAILKYYSMFKINIMICEEGEKPCAEELAKSLNINYQFIYSPKLWNRSLAFNVGYKNSNDDWFIFAEIDVVIDPKEMIADFEEVTNKDILVLKPYDDLIDLDESNTKRLIDNSFWYEITSKDLTNQLNTNYGLFYLGVSKTYKEMINLAGGTIIISRKAFETVGGWDEQFLGWGCDDNAMSHKLNKIITDKMLVQTHTGFHMWHIGSERNNAEKITWNEYYKANYENLKNIVRYSEEELKKYCESNLAVIGNKDKYKI